jgi:hypothetical protein
METVANPPLMPEINYQSQSIFIYPSLKFQSKFMFEYANNVSRLRVVNYNIWTQIEDQYVN